MTKTKTTKTNTTNTKTKTKPKTVAATKPRVASPAVAAFAALHPAEHGVVWEKKLVVAGRRVEFTIFADDEPALESLEPLVPFVTEAARFDAIAKVALGKDLASKSGETREYVAHHIEECGTALAKKLGKKALKPVDVLATLSLQAARLDPEERTATFDYSVGAALTDYVLAVVIGANGRVQNISMES